MFINQSAPRRPRVLVVEDHDDMRELLTQILQMSGYEVIEAPCADDALNLAAQTGFDLAIIDIGLPRKDGIQLMRELCQSRAVVAVAMSGYGMESHLRACRDAGFAAHLQKPVAAETLLETLRGLQAA
jgi:CheY-like chemotaxis protein